MTTSSCYPYPVGLRPASSSSRLTSVPQLGARQETSKRFAAVASSACGVMRIVYDRLTLCGEYLRVPQMVYGHIWTQLISKRTMHAACGPFVLIWHLTLILYCICASGESFLHCIEHVAHHDYCHQNYTLSMQCKCQTFRPWRTSSPSVLTCLNHRVTLLRCASDHDDPLRAGPTKGQRSQKACSSP